MPRDDRARSAARGAALYLAALAAACGGRTGLELPDGSPPDGGGPCTSSEDCDDGLGCNGTEICVAGACFLVSPPDCDDLDPCTADRCVEPGLCQHEPGAADADGDGFSAALCGGPDCDDGDASVNPAMAERCNSRDDDCDGLVDDLGEPTLVAQVEGEGSYGHGLAWAGGRFVVAWHRRVPSATVPLQVALITPEGEIDGPGFSLGEASEELVTPSVAADGAGFAVAWNQWSEAAGRHEIAAASFDLSGPTTEVVAVAADPAVDLQSPVLLAGDGGRMTLAYRHGDFGSGWSRIRVATREGGLWSEPLEVTGPEVEAFAPALVGRAGGGLGLGFLTRQAGTFGVAFLPLAADGSAAGEAEPVAMAGGFPYSIEVARDDEGTLLAWSELRGVSTGEMRAVRLSESGAPLGPDRALTDDHAGSTRPALAWSGSRLGLAYTHYADGRVLPTAPAEIRWVPLDASLEAVERPTVLSEGHERGVHPELRWGRDRFGVIWTAEDPAGVALYFQALCPR